ncbi:hypothetical protein JOM56_003893 [Amanita muscaria]
MDNAGWRAQRHAYEEQLAQRNRHRTQDGSYYPVEQVGPIPESSIGGSYTQPVPHTRSDQQITPDQLARMTPAERSQYYRVAHMGPPLQFMCGPLLKYDTVVDYVWYGAVLIVTADSGSTYSPAPALTYDWDQNRPSHDVTHLEHDTSGTSFDLGPHPADPQTSPPMVIIDARNGTSKQVEGQEIYVYADQTGSFTFWRFYLEVPLADNGQEVTYHINDGQRMHFHVPGRNQNMRWAAHSCNGFSAGVNPDDFRGPGFRSGYDPLWVDLLTKHAQDPFHVLVGGGDQLYCDRLMYEPEMQDWVALKPEEKRVYQLTEQITKALDRFFFHHYCQQFRHGAFARANCSIPMLNMCDDHGTFSIHETLPDTIDGFGSYPDELQRAPVFKAIGMRGYFYFLLFQHFVNVTVDGTDDRPGQHILKSLIIGDMGPYVQSPSHSLLSYLGPQCYVLLLDCRAERMLTRVCSPVEYDNVFSRVSQLPPQVEHLIVQLGIPIAYPRMVFLETALSSKLNPLVMLGKAGHLGSIGLSGFVNRFNADAELLDDLNDHWTSRTHKQERNWLVERLQGIARVQRLRISFVSGDVHCASVGVFKTLKPKHGAEIPIANDYRYMVNIITSAIVNTPPPAPVLAMVSSLAGKAHKALHHIETDETMVPLFVDDTDGSQRKQKYIMGKRNWCQVDWDPYSGELVFDLRVEQKKGVGTTVGYPTRVPPPNWPRA